MDRVGEVEGWGMGRLVEYGWCIGYRDGWEVDEEVG